MVPVMNKKTLLLLAILLIILTSACNGKQSTQKPSSPTPEANISTLAAATLQAALPTTSGTSSPSDTATTGQPAATLPPVFDLTRTEDNPITDAQQIIEILKALENIQRSQPISPGWYVLRTVNAPETLYRVYHVRNSQGNYDMYSEFLLSPERKILGPTEKIDGDIIYSVLGTNSSQMESYEGCCNIDDSNKNYYENFSETFYNDLTNWEKPSSTQWGEWAYAGWFEEDDSGYIFVLKEETTNIKGAYSRDPDTQELRAKKMEIIYTGFSLLSGYKVWEIHNTTLMNGKEVNTTHVLQRDYCIEMTCFPAEALDFLQENQVIDNSQQ